MDRCSKPKYEEMLHPYELGMLSETERRDFEIHLTECESCFRKALKLEDVAGIMKEDLDVRETVGEVAKTVEEAKPGGKRWVRVVVPVLAAVAAFAVFFLTDWRLEIGTTKEALAVPNRLAIMYFENLADPQDSLRLGEIATHLLITDLSESQQVEVVSSQRLYDILKLLGRKGEKRIDKDIATEVATKAQARWMLIGSVLQLEPQMILAGQLIEVASGTVIESQRIAADAGEDLFALVDRLTVEIKKDLALPAMGPDEIDRPVSYVTTHSLDAYRSFIKGREAFYNWNHKEAVFNLRESLRHDPGMAMAYFYLSFIGVSLGDPELQGLIGKAVENIDHVTQRERWNIRSIAAFFKGDMEECMQWGHKICDAYPNDKVIYFWLGFAYVKFLDEPARGVEYLNQAIKLDSLFLNPLGTLADAYEALGEHDKCLQIYARAISLSPQGAGGYIGKGNIHRSRGNIDSALAAYQDALQRDPDHVHALRRAGFLSIIKQQYENASSYFQRLAGSYNKTARAEGRSGQALIQLYQGRLRDGLAILDDGLSADGLEQNTTDPASLEKQYITAVIQSEIGNRTAAISGLRSFINGSRDIQSGKRYAGLSMLALVLAESADFSRAESALVVLKTEIDSTYYRSLLNYAFGQGGLAFAQGDYLQAIQYFTNAGEYLSSYRQLEYFPTHVMLARSHLGAGNVSEAVEDLENLLGCLEWGRVLHPTWSVKLHYWLALAHEQNGRTEDAIAQFEKFLDIWKHADPGIEAVEDARIRLAQLKTIS